MAFYDLEEAVEEQNARKGDYETEITDDEPDDVKPKTTEESGGLDTPAFPYDDVKQGQYTPAKNRGTS